MSVIVKKTEQQIKDIIINAANISMEKGELPYAELTAFAIEKPADASHGDYAVNCAMAWSKIFRNPPRKIAETLMANAIFDGTYINRYEIAGPGFINLFLSDSYYSDIIKDIHEKGDDYGRSNVGNGKTALVEFVSANPTGPMHIGNARGGALGDCLAAVLDLAGFSVEREFYINDAGNQIEKFGLSLELRYLQNFKDDIEMPEDSYHGADIIAHANAFAEKYGDSFVNVESSERKKALVEFALPKNIQALHDDLAQYRIEYDTWFKESSLHSAGETMRIVELLKQSGHTYEKEGALWFSGEQFGSEDFVLVRSNGIPTYIAPDIAYHYNKLVTRKFDKAINIWGADHHGYVPRLKAALSALSIDADKLDVVLMQMVRLVRNGEVIKASKRSGKAITLVTLLEEVPIDAARFFFNLREPNTHFDFDLDLAVEQSNQNPVYYVQYAYARICSILRNLSAEGVVARECTQKELSLLVLDEERELINLLSAFTKTVENAAAAYDPAKLTHYVVDVAAQFHKFYNSCRIKGVEDELLQARLSLCTATATVIKNVLNALKISTPESM